MSSKHEILFYAHQIRNRVNIHNSTEVEKGQKSRKQRERETWIKREIKATLVCVCVCGM